MGNSETKFDFVKSVIEFTDNQKNCDEEQVWDNTWLQANSTNELFTSIPLNDIRRLRDNNPTNFASFICKLLQCLECCRDRMVASNSDQKKVLACVRLLARVIPCCFEDEKWRGYFWTFLPSQNSQEKSLPMASILLSILSDLLFCPGFTVNPLPKNTTIESLSKVDSCEYIWQAGVGFSNKVLINTAYDSVRTEILKLLLICFSETIYDNSENRLRWIKHFTSAENRHVLPIFTSLINVVCAYCPVGYGLPYNYLLVTDTREPLVEASLQLLIVCLDSDSKPQSDEAEYADNFFVNYLSRIHREEDFEFILKGFNRLLNNTIATTYLPNSMKKISFYQELLVLLWKFCDYNQKFLFYILKTSDILELLVPILYHISDARTDPSRIGLIHMCIFLLLLLSGERNFGVRLNKPFTSRGLIDVPLFTGTHADLLIIVFHRLITSGNQKIQSLFDCLLTIIVNISPYLKSLSMVTATKLVHLVEAFSTPWFIFSSPTNHHLVFFLLEMFNNIIQYQFDGNSNLIYTIIRKRQVFYQLSNLNSDAVSIAQSLKKGGKNKNKDAVPIKEDSGVLESNQAANSSSQSGAGNGGNIEAKQVVLEFNSEFTKTPVISSMTDKSAEWSQPKNDAADPNKDNEASAEWSPTPEWVESWKSKLPIQTIMRMLQVLVPQVEKICIDKGLTDEGEIIKFLQHGTLVGLLPIPHPILIRKYIANSTTNNWFRTYLWGVIYLRNNEPQYWHGTNVNLFKVQESN